MFSIAQKRHIANEIQRILRELNHPELPSVGIRFQLHVEGEQPWSWADIRNSDAVPKPVDLWEELEKELTLISKEFKKV